MDDLKQPDRIVMDKAYRWRSGSAGDVTYWYVGSEKSVKRIVSLWTEGRRPGLGEIKRELWHLIGNFGVIVKRAHELFAAVDKVRSYPIFYAHADGQFCVSNSARALRNSLPLSEVDDLSLLEFAMAGYVTGRETLYRNLWQLQAGEFLLWEESGGSLNRDRYFLFYPRKTREEREETLIEELATITRRIFDRVAEEAGGRPIWVPLSGGLDSRLVLCQLKTLGYDSLVAFSYGAPGNYEAKAAREAAQRIGVPWHFFPVSMKKAKSFFYSPLRKQYWEYSDGLSNVPNMQDIHVLAPLLASKTIPQNAIVINGQSGDFITGGHIPASFMGGDADTRVLFDRMIEKHFSQWSNLKTETNLGRIVGKAEKILGVNSGVKVQRKELCGLYEWWEWQERQCKYVVSGQRIYDFLCLDWFLPLWDDEYLRFWSDIDFAQKYEQKLYRNYLHRMDFFGCFRNFQPVVWRWPGVSLVAVPMGRAIKLLLGKKSSERFYAYAKYFGHYRQFYSPYGLREYIGKATMIRGSNALNIERWLKENLGESLC